MVLVENFLATLKDKNLLKIAPAVVADIEALDDKAEGLLRARITSAHRLPEALIKKFEKIMIDRTGAQKIIWQKEIDKSLLGGAVIHYHDTVLDLSLKNTVDSLIESIHH